MCEIIMRLNHKLLITTDKIHVVDTLVHTLSWYKPQQNIKNICPNNPFFPNLKTTLNIYIYLYLYIYTLYKHMHVCLSVCILFIQNINDTFCYQSLPHKSKVTKQFNVVYLNTILNMTFLIHVTSYDGKTNTNNYFLTQKSMDF